MHLENKEMKVVILAGGLGTRMGTEITTIPKPLIEIGEKPILWHVMKIYSAYRFNDFVICLGYKSKLIKEYFLDYAAMQYDCTIYLRDNAYQIHQVNEEREWKITLIDTGLNTQTGGRLKRVQKYIDHDTFMVTYADGLANINIPNLLAFHKSNTRYGTLTGIHHTSRFGELTADNNSVSSFEEKSNTTLINGGFFVFDPIVFDFIEGDNDPLEIGLLKRLTDKKQLGFYEHPGFWQCADTPKEVKELNDLWNSEKCPWKVWK
jgi:glucose-1-phosphate cytidylyltransferase